MNDTLPAPLTPPDCDLRGLPYIPLDGQRLLDSDLFALSTGEEFKAALALWVKSWAQIPAASLPDDEKIIARCAGVTLAEWRSLAPMALRGWVKCSDGRLYHPVVAEKARHAWDERLAYRDRARKGGLAKAEKSRSAASSTENPASSTPQAAPDPASRTLKAAKGEGEGEGRDYIPPEGTRAPGDDLGAEAWRRGTAVLAKFGGLTAPKSRTFFGKLLKDNPGLTARDLLPSVITAEANGTQDPKAYLTAAAKGLANRRGGRPAGPSPQTWDDEVWRTACGNFRADGSWSPDMGPTPGSAGCMAPAAVLREFGWSAAA